MQAGPSTTLITSSFNSMQLSAGVIPTALALKLLSDRGVCRLKNRKLSAQCFLKRLCGEGCFQHSLLLLLCVRGKPPSPSTAPQQPIQPTLLLEVPAACEWPPVRLRDKLPEDDPACIKLKGMQEKLSSCCIHLLSGHMTFADDRALLRKAGDKRCNCPVHISLLPAGPEGFLSERSVFGMHSLMGVRARTHLEPNTSWKFRLGPLSKGHCVTRCFSNISMVVTLSHTIRACIPRSPPRLRANAMSTMNASRVSANLQEAILLELCNLWPEAHITQHLCTMSE